MAEPYRKGEYVRYACNGVCLVDDIRLDVPAGKGTPKDLALLDALADNIQGHTICALGDSAAMPVRAMLKHYRHEFAAKIDAAQKPGGLKRIESDEQAHG